VFVCERVRDRLKSSERKIKSDSYNLQGVEREEVDKNSHQKFHSEKKIIVKSVAM